MVILLEYLPFLEQSQEAWKRAGGNRRSEEKLAPFRPQYYQNKLHYLKVTSRPKIKFCH